MVVEARRPTLRCQQGCAPFETSRGGLPASLGLLESC